MAVSGSLLAFRRASSTDTLPSSSSEPSSSSSSSSLPSGASILLTDSLAVSGQPWLVHFVARALRPALDLAVGQGSGGNGSYAKSGLTSRNEVERGLGANKGGAQTGKRRVVVLGIREREEWWIGVLKKSGIQLATERMSGHFHFISLADPALSLAESFALVRDALRPSSEDGEEEATGPLVVLDDVSALTWIGNDAKEVVRWWNGLRSLLGPARATLLTLQHYAPSPVNGIEENPADTYLFHALLQRSTLWLQVEPLGGGGAATSGSSTSGEISVHLAPSYSTLAPFALDPSSGVLRASGSNARPFWVDEGAGGVEIGVKGRERIGGAGKWA